MIPISKRSETIKCATAFFIAHGHGTTFDMKTAIKTAVTAVRRSAAWYTMISLESSLAGALEILPEVRCPETHQAMLLAIRGMRRDLCAARAHYNSFSKPGVCRVWDLA
jgi:hypothetical protein